MEMMLNVSPLDALDELRTPQKCLLPHSTFVALAKAAPGMWAKCYLSDTTFALCQIYARDFPTGHACCYAGTDVIVGQLPPHEQQLVLHRIERAEEADEHSVITQCDCELLVNEKIFQRRPELAALSVSVRACLQQLTLTAGCRVRMQELQEIGIEEVIVVTADASVDMHNKLFTINESTAIHISNTQLLCALKPPVQTPWKCNEKSRRALQTFVEQLEQHNGWFRSKALVVGPSGVGKSALVEEVLRAKCCNCFCVRVSHVLGQYPGETEAELRRIFENARRFVQTFQTKEPTVLYFEDLHLLCGRDTDNANAANEVSRRVCSQLLHLLDEQQQQRLPILCVATSSQPEDVNEHLRRPGRFDYQVAIEPPSADERRAMFGAMLPPPLAHQTELTDLVGNYTQGYVLADMIRLAQDFKTGIAKSDGNNALALGHVLRESLQKCKPLAGRATEVQVLRPTQGFQTIGGMTQLKRILQVAILAGLQQPAAFQRFGLTMPKGLLLYGPPGCAKTTFAKCLASEAHMSFIATSGAEVYSPYVGCAERFLAAIFNTARKNAPCLIFLDEIDALIGRRSLDVRGSSDVQLRILSTLLTEMDGVIGGRGATSMEQHIMVVAATNRPDMVDDALLRPGRFDRLIHVPVPDVASRLAILQLYSQRMPIATDVVLSALAEATHNFSGADLCNLCNEAAMQAFQSDFTATAIATRDFDVVLQTTRPSLTQTQIDWYYEFERKFAA